MSTEIIKGFAHERFSRAREIFESNLSTGADIGGSFCATLEGETVVDLWGGFADEARTRAWQRDTIVNVYSTTKTMTALTALLLADACEIDLDAPVARYWPEFAANGKEHIKISHLLSHTSGLSGWREKITAEDLYDWDKMTSLLAAQAPLWEPGTASGYHVVTFGYLIGEVVRRVTGKSLGTVFREEIARPLNADFHIGLPAAEDWRVADIVPFVVEPDAAAKIEFTEVEKVTLFNLPLDPANTRSRAWRGAEIPAVNGHGNARSVAEIHAILANGGIAGGRRFLSEGGCRRALEAQIEGIDLIMPRYPAARFGMGFGLPAPFLKLDVPHPNTLHWGGGGCSWIIIDMDAHATFAYVVNKMDRHPLDDPRAFRIFEAMWQAMAG